MRESSTHAYVRDFEAKGPSVNRLLVVPAQAMPVLGDQGVDQGLRAAHADRWIPACAGMTAKTRDDGEDMDAFPRADLPPHLGDRTI